MIRRDKEWNDSAISYEKFEKKWGYYKKVANLLLQPLDIESDAKVLDLACGTGALTFEIAVLNESLILTS